MFPSDHIDNHQSSANRHTSVCVNFSLQGTGFEPWITAKRPQVNRKRCGDDPITGALYQIFCCKMVPLDVQFLLGISASLSKGDHPIIISRGGGIQRASLYGGEINTEMVRQIVKDNTNKGK